MAKGERKKGEAFIERVLAIGATIKEKATEFQVKKSRKHPKTLNLIHFMSEKKLHNIYINWSDSE